MKNHITLTINFVKEKLEGAEAGHDWFHIERVWKLSKKIAEKEVLYLNMQDDDWITETGMKLLMNETYVNMKPIYRTVHPHESNGEEIGHINFFRAKHSKLWNMVFDWFS